jgi:hypothetical protein
MEKLKEAEKRANGEMLKANEDNLEEWVSLNVGSEKAPIAVRRQ